MTRIDYMLQSGRVFRSQTFEDAAAAQAQLYRDCSYRNSENDWRVRAGRQWECGQWARLVNQPETLTQAIEKGRADYMRVTGQEEDISTCAHGVPFTESCHTGDCFRDAR